MRFSLAKSYPAEGRERFGVKAVGRVAGKIEHLKESHRPDAPIIRRSARPAAGDRAFPLSTLDTAR
jgi:hypothetical protein